MSAVEFALVAVVFFLFVFGIIDFSRALWEWNMAARATQAGVRFAVVSDPVANEIKTFNGLSLTPPVGNGLSVPLASFNGGNPVVCQKSGATGGCSTGWTYNDAAFQAIVLRIQAIYSQITDQDVIIEYEHIGLGFSGNPFGSDVAPAITVKLKPRAFTFVTPGLSGLLMITMPDFAAVMTGEDVSG